MISPSEGNINFFENSKEKKLQNNLLDWQNTLGYVSQNIYLADSSIAENIAFGKSLSEITLENAKMLLEYPKRYS